ncbi:hypothetical protein AKJ09_09582 [Labilithrix luteola]|uniref:Uncharacterized protein n=1 Tax=Labilithrix luteola TaxID=1391654 RepID=A0A0K1QB04_9BACT|nr:hypothetical protein [Labilithrix luteola]AKV02919.1 hypothetical protein AKJ09_09582 [Labilithrix luteola]
MIGHEIEVPSGEGLVRLVRALGQHRYVASRLHLVHAFTIEAACAAGPSDALTDARAWAEGVLANASIERDSKDERLYRKATDAELVVVLSAFWNPGPTRGRAKAALEARLREIGVDPDDRNREAFDEAHEEDLFPVLVDAGWELLPLRALDPERHKGAMSAFDDGFAFDVAKFEEENAVPPLVTLHEMPALGAVELLHAVDEAGALGVPFVLWANGNETYLDYVLRGVLKIAKLDTLQAS